MSKINLRNFDLNLLVIFDALMTERNVSRAAEKVFLSQPAMSHALNRLRKLLDDQILVKTEQGLEPTPRALAMELPVREAIFQIQQSLFFPEPFDPDEDERCFNMYTSEHFEYILLAQLIKKLAESAPRVSVELDFLGEEIPESGLASGSVHFVMGIEGLYNISKRLRSQVLLEEDFVVVTRKDHPRVKGSKATVTQIAELGHVYFSEVPYKVDSGPYTPLAIVDKWFRDKKISPRVAVRTASYYPAVEVVTNTDYIMILPRRIATMMQRSFDFQIVEPPEDFTVFKLNMIWHPLFEKAPAHIWMRGQILEQAEALRQSEGNHSRS